MRVPSVRLACIGTVVFVVAAFAACAGQAQAEDQADGSKAGRILERLKARQRQGETAPQKPQQRGEELEIAGLHVHLWRPAGSTASGSSAVKQAVPLVVFSHGFHGVSTQSTFLMQALADDGYLVVAPNHKEALRLGSKSEFSLRPEVGFAKADDWTEQTYRDRADDIKALLKGLKNDEKWASKIDWNKVALAGHSLGGYTVLGVAGAWPGWKTGDIKAVLALSPYCSPFVNHGNLDGLRMPVMYQGGTRDIGITPFVKRSGGAFDLTPAPAYFIEFEQAGHFAWTDLSPEFQPSITYYSLAFLNKHLKGDKSADPTKKLANVADVRSK